MKLFRQARQRSSQQSNDPSRFRHDLQGEAALQVADRLASESDFTSTQSLESLLAQLYQQQRQQNPGDTYLVHHGSPKAIRNHVLTFGWYRPWLPDSGRILDWGCNQAPDSCLLRATCGEKFELHGCDFPESERFGVFHKYAQFEYQQLRHHVELPYPDNHFDVVIGSGVLEHATMDYESLKELWRILEPAGKLVISYLPNRLSVQEWYLRVVKKAGFHKRRYGLTELGRTLVHYGFYPLTAGYHNFAWNPQLPLPHGSGQLRASRMLGRIVPMKWLCSTLCVIAQKEPVM